MASLRILRRRIRSIQSTKQVMRAMQLVSGSKFKRAHHRLLQGRKVLEFLDALLQRLLASVASPEQGRGAAESDLAHPLSMRNEHAPSALVIITSDAGLAGSYNTNLIQLAESELRRDTARKTQLICIGKRGHRYFAARGYVAQQAYGDLAGRPDVQRIDAIGRVLMERFLSSTIGSVRLLYAKFVSPTVSRPTVKQWLPIQLVPASSLQPLASTVMNEYIFEPSVQQVFEDLLPRWTMATFRLAMLEAFTAEHGARMIAMKNATDNAQELLGNLTQQRNRIRQASITKELSEIVGTAEALK